MAIIDHGSRDASPANGRPLGARLFQALVENSTDTIFRIDLDTEECIYVSPAVRSLLGRDPATIIGLPLTQFVHPEDAAEVLARSARRRQWSGVRTAVTRMSHHDGARVWVQATAYSKAVPPQELARTRETWAAVTLGGETRRRTGNFRAANGDLVHLEVITAPIRSDGHIVGTFGIAIPGDAVPPRPETELSSRQLDVCVSSSRARAPARSPTRFTWRRTPCATMYGAC